MTNISAHTVLLVDGGGDDASVRLLEEELVSKGCLVSTVRRLADAGEYLSRHSPDVILLDAVLPDGSGIEFCERIQGLTGAPVLFRTSAESLDELQRAMDAGGSMYFDKSECAEEVAARVNAALRRRVSEKAHEKRKEDLTKK